MHQYDILRIRRGSLFPNQRHAVLPLPLPSALVVTPPATGHYDTPDTSSSVQGPFENSREIRFDPGQTPGVMAALPYEYRSLMQKGIAACFSFHTPGKNLSSRPVSRLLPSSGRSHHDLYCNPVIPEYGPQKHIDSYSTHVIFDEPDVVKVHSRPGSCLINSLPEDGLKVRIDHLDDIAACQVFPAFSAEQPARRQDLCRRSRLPGRPRSLQGATR